MVSPGIEAVVKFNTKTRVFLPRYGVEFVLFVPTIEHEQQLPENWQWILESTIQRLLQYNKQIITSLLMKNQLRYYFNMH